MAIKINPNLEYQNDAINSVVDLFKGQERFYYNLSVYDPGKYPIQTMIGSGVRATETGFANNLELTKEDLIENLNEVKRRNGLKEYSGELDEGNLNFAVEMETGTGKTYVYIKTIMELNKKYGFNKYIILVPSVAIREGVLFSLKSLKEHFEYHYDGETYHDFQYSSERLDNLMDFARNDKVEIMVMTIQSFDSDNKVLNSDSQKHLEKTDGEKPLEVIRKTNPIVIIDEPQTTSNSEQRKNAIKNLNPLCTLQYSATHKENEDVHKVYRLTSVDAYIKQLVKQIEVASVISKNDHNYAYVKLVDVKPTKKKVSVRIELDVRDKKNFSIKRKTVSANLHDDLFDLSGEREIYSNLRIEKITAQPEKSIEINGKKVYLDEAINDFDEDLLKIIQIRKTIEEHLEKEKRLNPKGIKVLSLFFIDKVSNYRGWNEDAPVSGKYLDWFEEEYMNAIKKYDSDSGIEKLGEDVALVHQGYFAEDKKNRYKDTKGESQDDIKAYDSIMSDKEYLLSFENPIRFIFSHSALREGWDNPNVFQICTLNENSKNNDKKRQELGRGLRLCVTQEGERVYGFDTNTLTVMANQSYEDYAKQLQTEIETEEGFKFGSLEDISFAGIPLIGCEKGTMSTQESKELFDFFKGNKYIDESGKTTESLKRDLKNSMVKIPEKFKEYQYDVICYLKKVCGNLNLKDKENVIKYGQNKRVISDNPYFVELWDRIKDRTKYSIRFDSEELVRSSIEKIKKLRIEGIELEYKKSKITKNTTGIEGFTVHEDVEYLYNRNRFLPDIITFLQRATNLTRQTVVKILRESETLHMFYVNPQRYMSSVAEEIKNVINEFVLSGIKYTKLEGSEFYLQEVFPDEELEGCIVTELVKSDRSVYEYNRYDSKTEREFAEALQNDDSVLVYTKLPTKKFTVPTPVGEYTPDWAVVLNKDNLKKLYFVVETKGDINEEELRGTERLKVLFGKKRFEDIDGAGYILANKGSDIKRSISSGLVKE